jgi:hypothetical protein
MAHWYQFSDLRERERDEETRESPRMGVKLGYLLGEYINKINK